MPINLKDLIVVLVISSIVFKFAKSTVLLFSTEKDFTRRRNVWFALTIAAFLTPNIWVYALIAAPFLIVCGRKDSNPAALYLFVLHAVPSVAATIPLPGNAKFIDLSNPTLLTLCVIAPALGRLRRADKGSRIQGLRAVDYCLLAYGVLTSILYIHLIMPNGTFYQSSLSDFVRRLIEFALGVFVPYFLISRTAHSRRIILDNVASLLLPCVVMAAIAIFESTRGWLLYEAIPRAWDLADPFTSYFVRGSSLRGMASTPHSLSLGYDLAISFGLWLSLQTYVTSRTTRYAVTTVICLGLIATYSRGPWACTVLIYVAFVMLRPGATSAFLKSLLGATAVLAVIGLSPYGRRIAALIPFLGGNVGNASIDYREQLLNRGWAIFRESPLLGDQYALSKMQDLRQGQGIIDFINGYVLEALSTGIVGLSLFLAVLLSALLKVIAAGRAISKADPQLGSVGLSLGCGVLGTLFLWATGGADVRVLWALVAMAVAYSHMRQAQRIELLGDKSTGAFTSLVVAET